MDAVQEIDPRAKLLALGIFSAIPLFSDSWVIVAVSSASLLTAAAIQGIAPLRVLIRTVRVSWFVATILVLQALTNDGKVILALGDLIFTLEGVWKGLELSARLVILLWGSFILASTSPERIVAAFETWLHPVRHRFGAIVMLVTVTMNLVPGLVLQSRRLALSFRSRGVDIDTGVIRRIRFLTSAALPLFASSWRASSQLAMAMESRSYDPSASRTTYVHLQFTSRDWLVLAVTVTLAGTCLIFFS